MKILTGLITIPLLLLLCMPALAVEFEPLANFSIEEVMTQIPGHEEQLTFDSVYDWKPRVDDRYVTWVVYDGEGKVWYYDSQGGKRDMVANVPGDQNDPDISGGVIVWDDNRNGNSDIYSYNIAMNKENLVYGSTSNKFRPVISNDIVAFEDYGTDDIRDIGFKNAGSTANPVYIDPNAMDKANPDIDGDWIVYQQLDDGKEDWNIYAYNIKTQQLIQVTRDTATQQNPRISGDLIVWEDNRNGKWDIFMYNIKKDLSTAVTYDDVDDRSPSISGSNIVWTRIDQDGTSNIYIINLQIPKTYIVSGGPGNQISPDINVDKVVWQDDRFGGWDIFLYTLQPDTPFRSYEFYGPVTLNYEPAPVGTVLQAKVDGRTKDTITVTQAGYYGGEGSYADKLSVDVNQADIGRYITFWTEGFQGSPSVPIAGDGTTRELPLSFVYAQPLPDLSFYGSVSIDGQPAPQGTKLIAKIDDVVRGEYTTTQTGQYGGAGEQDPVLKIPLTENDLGKHVTFWQDDYKAVETFQITSGGKFSQDLSFTEVSPLTPYEFYGYVQFDGKTAPAGTNIQARMDGSQVTSYVTRYAGSYGGPGDNPEDPRLIVPVKEADVGKTISFWSGTRMASSTQVVARSGEHIIRKDLDFSTSGVINADFIGYPTTGNAPLTVKFTDLSTGNPTMWVWDFGDGPIPLNASSCSGDNCNSIENPVHTYTQTGTYTVTLTASNQDGSDTEVKQAYITVGGSPGFMADFTASPTSGNAPLTVRFTDLTVGGPTMWAWDFGDGSTDTIGSPTHTYTKDGTYTVTLRASNQYGNSDTEVKQAYIVVGSSPSFMTDFTASPTSGSAPLTVKFTDLTVGGPTMWSWDFGDGTADMVACPTHTYTQDGTYTVTLRSSNQYGGSDTEVKQGYIVVGSSPGINTDFTGYPRAGNSPLTVKFTDLSTGNPTMWVWDFGDGPIPLNVSSCTGDSCNTIANPVHTYSQSGTYTVSLTASNKDGSDTEVKQGYIVVGGSSAFMTDFTASPTSGSAPLTVKFTDLTVGGPTMWSWDFGDGTTDMVASPTHTYTKDGSYTVTLRSSNQYGGSDSEVKQAYIVVGSSPGFMADFSASPTTGSPPLTVKFTDKTIGGPTIWAWNFGDGSTDMIGSPTHTYTKNGTYTVTLTASNQYGNSDTESKTNYISVLDVPPSPDSIPVSAGWNFVSVPKKLAPGKDSAAIFANIDVDGHSIFQYDSVRGQWVTLTQTSQIKPLDAVWLFSKKVDTVPLTFDTDPLQIPPTRELKRGWNAIGFTGFESLEAKFTLLSVQDKWVNCLGFTRELQRYNEMIIKGRNDDTKLNPYNGYWLFMSDDGVLAAISA